jgi:cytochrome b
VAATQPPDEPEWQAYGKPLIRELLTSNETAEALEQVHNVLANVTLAFVLAHIAAVVLASFAHHENLIRSMFTGYKRR